jgi:hypothetical protein
MARVVVFVPDLLFGSRVIEAVRSAGHEPVLAGEAEAEALAGAEAVIVDLTADAAERIRLIAGARPAGAPVLAFYSHVEADVRALGLAAGFEVVVPRSRMAREGPELVSRLLAE